MNANQCALNRIECALSVQCERALSAKWLEREDFWYRELCTVYPYGLNDNVRRVGNVSKQGPNIVVHTLFNRQHRKSKKRELGRGTGVRWKEKLCLRK